MAIAITFGIVCAPVLCAEVSDPNQAVLSAIRKMPKGGGYSVSADASQALRESHRLQGNQLQIQPSVAQPSYCSGATYLVLLQALSDLQKSGAVNLQASDWEALSVKPQKDGHGVWGRWNANGPGTAVLFHELKAGRNFIEPELARAGDFLKIWWNNAVGKEERGHLVVFLRLETRDGVPGVLFWSANKPGGYGEKWVPMSSCKRLLFSRLEHPQRFGQVNQLQPIEPYLSTLLIKPSHFKEAMAKSGVNPL